MGETRRTSLFWPFLLIAAGVVLLLSQFGIWDVHWIDLLRLWPLLLILVGLDILLSGTRLGAVVFLIVALGVLVLAVVLITPGQRPADELASQTLTYPLEGADRAEVTIDMGVGELELDATAESPNLVEALILYNEGSTTVAQDATTEGGVARVTIRGDMTANIWIPFGRRQNERWEVRLNPEVPVQLIVDGGVSRTRLDLRGLVLDGLDINGGVGNVDVVLAESGAYEVSVDGGVGQLRLEVPPELEARMQIDGGLGSVDVGPRFGRDGEAYVTAGYADAEDRVDITIDGGLGSISVR